MGKRKQAPQPGAPQPEPEVQAKKAKREDELSSKVEQHFLELSGRRLQYAPREHIGVIEVSNFPALGKLTALRFIEWVQQNPGGVISLPTGKTPEHFIKWVVRYLETWDQEETQKDLREHGVDPSTKPDMKSLHFVQIDDFYPIDPAQHNSFHFYVKKYYIQQFGLDPAKCMLIDTWTLGCPEGMNAMDVFPHGEIDLSLRHAKTKGKPQHLQQHVLASVDEFCTNYERQIRELGGIGFFLGGIGPDGHIAFNIRGADHFSTTRLTPTNYETQAAAAGDLGGIELARKTLVITIGLQTITFNPNVVAIVAAAGEAKAKVVADTIQNPASNNFPGSVLHGMANTRFYLTQGACLMLEERLYQDLANTVGELSERQKHKPVIDRSLALSIPIRDLTVEHLKADRFTKFVLDRIGEDKARELVADVERSLVAKIDRAMARMSVCPEPSAPPGARFMHTAPHHDDIMLGYLPYVVHLVRPCNNSHSFNYMTSGFNSVTNGYVTKLVKDAKANLQTPDFAKLVEDGYFDPDNKQGYHGDIAFILDAVAGRSRRRQAEGTSRRVVRILVAVFGEHTLNQLVERCDAVLAYLKSRYPGQKDSPEYQKFKGMIRELEADLLWGYFGFNESVHHLRLGFYKGEYFTEAPTPSRDVQPILDRIKAEKPNIVTVAFDPEGSGPDTHYKVMQAVCQALRFYKRDCGVEDVEVWGYRNVWYRFHPVDADLMVPVSLNSMAILDDSFNVCFGSQRMASFPAPEFDGPFCRYAQRIQAEQLQALKTCLGHEFFENSKLHLLKRTHGLCFLKVMSMEEFFQAARELHQSVSSQAGEQ